MSWLWCSLPVFLAVVAGMVVAGQTTRETLGATDSTEPAPEEATQNPSKFSESTTENSATPPPLDPSSATVPPLDPSSATVPPLDPSSATVPPLDSSSASPQPLDPSSASFSPPDPSSATPQPLDPSSATPPPLDPSSAAPSSLDPTSTPLANGTGSPIQLASTAGTPTTSTSVHSTTGVLSHTTQDFNASQQASTVLTELSTFLSLETETDVSQGSSPTNGSQHWTTEHPGTETDTPQVSSASTAVTNTSELGGYVHLDVQVKTQPPPTSTLTSTKEQPTGSYLVTTEATTTEANESIPLKPTTSLASKAFKTTTRSYSRLSTAQVATKKMSLVAQCLIAIAILAGVCTIFVICTVVLCTKLSSQRRNYRVNSANGTELICISALLPEEERQLRRKMRPKRLREHLKETAAGYNSDSDDDDLTLHSFVTEH
ncbi:P-selectin glycoprotein ligand 1 [Mustelus asterias]